MDPPEKQSYFKDIAQKIYKEEKRIGVIPTQETLYRYFNKIAWADKDTSSKSDIETVTNDSKKWRGWLSWFFENAYLYLEKDVPAVLELEYFLDTFSAPILLAKEYNGRINSLVVLSFDDTISTQLDLLRSLYYRCMLIALEGIFSKKISIINFSNREELLITEYTLTDKIKETTLNYINNVAFSMKYNKTFPNISNCKVCKFNTKCYLRS